MLRYCANLKAIRYGSASLNRIVADKSHHVIVACHFSSAYGLTAKRDSEVYPKSFRESLPDLDEKWSKNHGDLCNAESCAMNNGNSTGYFSLERGTRRAILYPISLYTCSGNIIYSDP